MGDPEAKSARDGGRRSPTGRRWALALASFAFAAGLGECALRLARPNPYRDERPDWVLPPAVHHAGKDLPVDRSALDPESPVVRLRTDARGYLLPARRFERPDATIAFLGGSSTECAALDEEERWPALVGRILETRGIRAETLNAGKSGNTSHDAVNALLNHVVHERPDVAVLMEAVNDYGVLSLDPEYRTRSDSPMTARQPLRWLLQRLSSESALVGALRQRLTVREPEPGEFVRAVSERVPTIEFERRLRAFAGVCRAFGIEPVLMTQPFAPARTALTPEWTDASDQERFNEAIREVARAESVVLIDLARHVKGVPGWDRPMQVFYDGIHVTADGARLYADYVAARLLEAVPRLRSGPPPAPGPPSARSR